MSSIEWGKIRLAQVCGRYAPDFPQGRRFQAGELVSVLVMGWPGLPYPAGSVGATTSPNGAHQDWVFWTGADIDCSLIFTSEDVAELIICPELAAQVQGIAAPFTVTIDPALSPPLPPPPEFEIGDLVEVVLMEGAHFMPPHLAKVRGPIIERRAGRFWSYRIQTPNGGRIWLSDDYLQHYQIKLQKVESPASKPASEGGNER